MSDTVECPLCKPVLKHDKRLTCPFCLNTRKVPEEVAAAWRLGGVVAALNIDTAVWDRVFVQHAAENKLPGGGKSIEVRWKSLRIAWAVTRSP